MDYLLVFVGGGLGSIARFLFSKTFAPLHNGFPLATLMANIVSALLMGVLAGVVLNKTYTNQYARFLLFTTTGFCGGFSTFSTFSYETFNLLSAGQAGMALANVGLNVLVCLVAVAVGFYVSRFIL